MPDAHRDPVDRQGSPPGDRPSDSGRGEISPPTALRHALLSDDAARCYERLVRVGAAPPDALRLPEWSGLAELVAFGLADTEPLENKWLPIAPDTAIAHLADVRARRLAAFADAAAAQDKFLAGLQPDASRVPRQPSRFGTEVLTDTSHILAVVNELPLRATKEMLSLQTPNQEFAVFAYAEPVTARRLAFRTIEQVSAESTPGFDALLRNAELIGEEVRLARVVPLRLMIADESEALMASAGRGLAEAIYTRSPELVCALREFFELIWAGARPVTGTAGGRFSRVTGLSWGCSRRVRPMARSRASSAPPNALCAVSCRPCPMSSGRRADSSLRFTRSVTGSFR